LLRQGGIDAKTAFGAIPTAAKTPAAEQKIARLMETGLDRNTAIAIADGRIVVSNDPVTGEVFLLDKSSGQRIEPKAQATTPSTTEAKAAPEQKGMFDEVDVVQSLGAGGWAKGIANVVTDAIGSGQAFPEAGTAAAGLENLQARTVLMTGVDIAGKPSNFTREEIRDKLTVTPSEISTGPDAALKKTTNMVRLLEETYAAAVAASEGKSGASVQQRKDAKASIPMLTGLLRDYRSLETALSKKTSPSPSPAVDQDVMDTYNYYIQQMGGGQ
jgi:hypothetical protein